MADSLHVDPTEPDYTQRWQVEPPPDTWGFWVASLYLGPVLVDAVTAKRRWILKIKMIAASWRHCHSYFLPRPRS